MAEEHDEQQIIERALTRMVESEDEGPLTKVGRKCNVGVGRVRIKLPPLSVALVEEHKELAKVSIGAKDMAIKNKNVWKTVKLTQDQLNKAQECIAQLESNMTTTHQNPEPTSNEDELRTFTGKGRSSNCNSRKSEKGYTVSHVQD